MNSPSVFNASHQLKMRSLHMNLHTYQNKQLVTYLDLWCQDCFIIVVVVFLVSYKTEANLKALVKLYAQTILNLLQIINQRFNSFLCTVNEEWTQVT